MDQDTPTPTGFGTTRSTEAAFGSSTNKLNDATGTDNELCPHCGQSTNRGGLEQFLGRIGISDEMVNNLKTQFQNVDLDEYLDTARGYLKDTGNKASTFAKDNPGKLAAGVAVLAVGAGLLFSTLNRDR